MPSVSPPFAQCHKHSGPSLLDHHAATPMTQTLGVSSPTATVVDHSSTGPDKALLTMSSAIKQTNISPQKHPSLSTTGEYQPTASNHPYDTSPNTDIAKKFDYCQYI